MRYVFFPHSVWGLAAQRTWDLYAHHFVLQLNHYKKHYHMVILRVTTLLEVKSLHVELLALRYWEYHKNFVKMDKRCSPTCKCAHGESSVKEEAASGVGNFEPLVVGILKTYGISILPETKLKFRRSLVFLLQVGLEFNVGQKQSFSFLEKNKIETNNTLWVLRHISCQQDRWDWYSNTSS